MPVSYQTTIIGGDLYYTYTVTWYPPVSTPVGAYKEGFLYSDGHIGYTSGFINVIPAVYNVYTDAPCYSGAESESTTTIHYTLSSAVDSCTVSVAGRSIIGSTAAGENTVTWDGKDSSGEYVDAGNYPITITTSPTAGQRLQISNLSTSLTYTLGSSTPLEISFDVSEPVRRSYATEAYLTSVIYDSAGNTVKVLANSTTTDKLNNLADKTDGQNSLSWDGTDDYGDPVDSGTYTMTLVAKDNAGVGSESDCITATIDVVDEDTQSDQPTLEWPSGEYGGDDDGTVSGYTDSGQPVYYSYDGVTWESVTPDSETGAFSITLDQTPGPQTIILRTSSASLPNEATVTRSYFVNSFDITSPVEDSRFDPQTSGNISLQFTSDYTDSVNIYVQDYYDQETCISSQDPRPATDMLNGNTGIETVRHITASDSPMSVVAGSSSVSWDGKDDSGQFVPPGLYSIVIERANADGLLDLSVEKQVIIEHPADAPQITSVDSSTQEVHPRVLWVTDVPTTGYLVYSSDETMGKVAMSDGVSTIHQVDIPAASPNTIYDYYIIATNPVTGATAISSKETLTTRDGVAVGNISYCINSSTSVDITYSSQDVSESDPDTLVDVPVVSAIKYAEVGPSISTLDWHTLENDTPSGEYTFNLTDLTPNAEYVYMIVAASDSTWSDSTASQYMWFTTKTAPASIDITNLTDGASVSSISDIVVSASDTAHRFSAHGITTVELYVDDQLVDSYDEVAGGDYIDYTFHAGSLNLGNGVHQIEAVAYDDFWNDTHKHIRIALDSESLMQTQSAMSTQSSEPIVTIVECPRQARVVSERAKLAYRAGPRKYWDGGNGSRGYLYLTVYTADGKCERFHWDASSGCYWDITAKNKNGEYVGALPPGLWRTGRTSRVGGKVEGVPSRGDGLDYMYRPWIIHISGAKVKGWPAGRQREAFHIHGIWDPAHGGQIINGEKHYTSSYGCIILNRANIVDLKNKWETYVLHGAEHGKASVGIPCKVERFNKKIAP
ncbi:hypothetical protein LLG46_12160 [bacterium]|nr:hypothetical protein [bacterium]